jgi:hypothetical protein
LLELISQINIESLSLEINQQGLFCDADMTFCALKALQGHFASLARSSLFQLLAVKAA